MGQGNTSDIDQLDQAGGTATVTQIGDDHNSIVSQTSDGSQVEVNQSNLNNSSSVIQGRNAGNSFQTNSQEALINQSGLDNESWVTQSGSNGDVNVNQSGDNNDSTITQSGFDNSAGDSDAAALVGVDQSGSDNKSFVTQSGQLSDAFVSQIGDDNTARITQSVNNAPNPAGGTDPRVATASIT